MKNKFFSGLLLLLVAILLIIGFKTWNKTDCCQKKEYPYEMHISAMRLMQACQDLVITDGAICENQSRVTISVMPASGYANGGKSGMVSFTEFYYPDDAVFHTSWQPRNQSNIYGCAPNPNFFPFPDGAANDVYELGLIPVAEYQAAPTNFPATGNIHGVIKTQDITAIENIRLESATGYIKINEPLLYDSMYSSKGFVCDVFIKGKTGKTPCYIINNYDGAAAAVKWKVKKECQ